MRTIHSLETMLFITYQLYNLPEFGHSLKDCCGDKRVEQKTANGHGGHTAEGLSGCAVTLKAPQSRSVANHYK